MLVSHGYDGALKASSFNATSPAISADGKVIAFTSQAVNLVANFPNANGKSYAPFAHAYVYQSTTGQIGLIDHQQSSASNPGNDSAIPYDISADGRFVLYFSRESNLLGTTSTSKGDIYRFDLQTGSNVLVSRSSNTVPYGGNGLCSDGSMSADGKWVVFFSKATNLVAGSTGTSGQVYLWNGDTGQLTFVSHSKGNPLSGGNAMSNFPTISNDGNYVGFLSAATDLVTGFVDGNVAGSYDVFLYDRITDQSTLVSHQVGSMTVSANGDSRGHMPSLSNDGSVVIFGSRSTDLVPGFTDGNGDTAYDLYRYDRTTGLSTLVSGKNGSATASGNLETRWCSLSDDGTILAWKTAASDMMSSVLDTNGSDDVFIRDYALGTTVLVSSRSTASLSPGGKSDWVQQTPDGRYVVFTSAAINIVAGQVNIAPVDSTSSQVFLTDRQTHTTVLVSHASGGLTTTGNDRSTEPVISADGRYIAYCSYATNLVAGFVDGNGPGDTNSTGTDIFLFDRVTGQNVLVSHNFASATLGANDTSGTGNPFELYYLYITDDGRYVAFASAATDLVSSFIDTNGQGNNGSRDIFLYDRMTNANTVVSHQAGVPTVGSTGWCYQPQISADGNYVVYWSWDLNSSSS
ncbi:MAG: TolB family protein [Gemmataceae bacterium]